jgi:hypothetical protein
LLGFGSPFLAAFIINQLPKVEFFTVAANVPSITLGETAFGTPFRQIPIQGDTITFDQLSISFIVDEYLENYLSLHDWITGVGFPKTTEQFTEFRDVTSETPSSSFPARGINRTSGISTPDKPNVSDATLTILSNKNNPIVEVRFRDLYPVSLGALDYDQGATDVEYLRTTAGFSYQLYEIVAL